MIKLSGRLLYAVVACLTVILVASGSVYAHETSYAYYHVNVQSQANSHSFSFAVNETLSPAPEKGMSVLGVALTSDSFNDTYSTLVNSSLTLLPYIPTLPNDTLTYSYGGYMVHLLLKQETSSQVVLSGSTLTADTYLVNGSVYAQNSTAQAVFAVSGTLEKLASGLLYSIKATLAARSPAGLISYGVTVQLESTNLPLTSPSDPPTSNIPTIAGATVVSVAAILLAAFGLKFRHRASVAATPTPYQAD
ncbi:MAG: hypothetical protein QW767_03975 [Thermoprotei archaeon]